MAVAALERAPKLEGAYENYCYHAFADLQTERALGMAGAGPIPYSAIREMAREDELSRAETELLHYVIRALDNDYLERQSKRLAKQSK